MSTEYETYLGDSVYARWMGVNAGVYIYLNNGMGEKNHIFLEPEVLNALNVFCERMRRQQATAPAPTQDKAYEA